MSSLKSGALVLVVLMFRLKKFTNQERLRCIRVPIVRKSRLAISGIRFCLRAFRS